MKNFSYDSWYPKGTLEEPFLPVDVTKLEAVFPGNVSRLMPPVEDIPEEFCKYGGTEWNRIQSQWFFSGLNKKTEWVPKEGIDKNVALRHLRTIQGSFEPKHEYKEAAIAFLMSLWFSKVKNWKM